MRSAGRFELNWLKPLNFSSTSRGANASETSAEFAYWENCAQFERPLRVGANGDSLGTSQSHRTQEQSAWTGFEDPSEVLPRSQQQQSTFNPAEQQRRSHVTSRTGIEQLSSEVGVAAHRTTLEIKQGHARTGETTPSAVAPASKKDISGWSRRTNRIIS